MKSTVYMLQQRTFSYKNIHAFSVNSHLINQYCAHFWHVAGWQASSKQRYSITFRRFRLLANYNYLAEAAFAIVLLFRRPLPAKSGCNIDF